MASTLTAELARTIRTLRSQRHLSARQLSELCITAGARSLTRSTIAKIESGGRQSVTLDEVAALAQAFGVPPHAFFAPAQSALHLGRRVKRVFIVYAEYDQSLADTLKELLDAWGFSASFCRQEIREVGAAQLYQQELSGLLADADLVLLVLSNAFRYSTYCQVETGAATIDGKPVLTVIIPPVGLQDISQVSPVIERHEPIDASKPGEFVRVLEHKLAAEISPERMPEVTDIPRLDECKQAVRSALASLIESYDTAPPTAALTGFWRSLTDPAASRSIVAHIFRAVEDGETDVAIAGVSLKYSINILGEAIAALENSRDPARPLLGPLNISLIHMDEQSHILHSLEDGKDINAIVEYFRVRWASTKASWEAAGERAGIKLNIADPVAIDYIPQQVGVRIHSVARQWSVLYAGTCSFTKEGKSTRLLVGEREYEFHTSSIPNPYSSTTRNFSDPAIEVFNQYIKHYGDRGNNGVALVLDNREWLQRLERCVADYQDIGELIVVSNTSKKLLPLIALALNRGIAVKAYSAHPDLLPPPEASLVQNLPERLKEEETRRGLGRPGSGTAELLYLRHVPTFRAALIGDSVLGFEPYVVAPRIGIPSTAEISNPAALAGDDLVPSGLRVIATKYSNHFEKLRAMVREQCRDANAKV
jgi:transcriptional regulator with XRE-family HTH domain